MDLMLGDLRDQRTHGADHVRRLERAVKRQLALDLVERRDALAGLERAGVDARIGNHLPDGDVGLGEGRIGGRLVAGLPGEDVVVMLALAVRALGLVLEILADHRRAVGHGLHRVDIDRQRLVFDFDQIGAVGRRFPGLRDHEGDLLILEQHFAVGQHHLHVARKCRHPGEVDGLQYLGGDHRDDAGHCGGLRGVDLLDAGMGVRRAVEFAIQHAGQFDVVDVIAFALGETDILDALALTAHAFELDGAFGGGGGHVVHSAAS